jgi:hypothetical protein
VLVVEMMGLEPTTPCLQSQIGQGRHLARQRTAHVMAAVRLSVGVRLQPLVSVVNGTVVARPARATFVVACQSRHQLDRRVRPVPETPDLLARATGPRQPWVGFEAASTMTEWPRRCNSLSA